MERASISIASEDVNLTKQGGVSIIDYPKSASGSVMFNDKATPVDPRKGEGELSHLIGTGWDFMNHGDGLLYDTHQNLLSKPEATDPLPAEVPHDASHDGVGALQQYKQDHPWFHNGIDVDGNPDLVNFPGDTHPHARYSSTQKPGYLVLEKGIVPPAAPMVSVVPVDSIQKADQTVLFQWPEKQVLLRTQGLSNQTITFRTVVPQGFTCKALPLGMGAISEVPGQPTTPHNVQVSRNGQVVVPWSAQGGISPSIDFNGPGQSGGSFDVKGGDTLDFSIRNDSGQPGDVLFDFGAPGR